MKNRIPEKLLPLFAAIVIIAPSFFAHSCANTTQSPSGGDKDSIAPALYWVNPAPGATGVPTRKTKIVFGFDEYVNIKESKNIFLSPPQAKAPKSKVSGKTVVVSFEEALDSNTTYTINFTDALADVNEGNVFPGFTYVFSTGLQIDSMMLTGTVVDCNTLNPIKGATVMLYKDHSDSAVFKTRPFAACKTDDWGYFALPYLKDTLYRLYAIKDENGDNMYQAETEQIAFLDSLVRPTMVAIDTLKELQKYDPKDTLECRARTSQYELRLFKEELRGKQKLMNTGRPSPRKAYVTFQSPDVWIDSLWIKGYKADRLITQFNRKQDSLEIWINDRRPVPDTLRLFVNYRKSNDSTSVLEPVVENFKLVMEKPQQKKTGAAARMSIKHEDTICVFKLKAEPETVEQYGFDLQFDYPLIYESFDSLKFHYINPRQKDVAGSFTVEKDTLNPCHFRIFPKEKLLPGYEYYLKVPHRGFRDINGFWNDSTEVKVSLPKDEKLSTIVASMQGVDSYLIVDLLSEKRDKVLRSYTIKEDTDLVFPYLKEGKYSLRITYDLNANSLVDTGNLLEHKQPEKVVFFKLEDGSEFLELPAATELTQIVTVKELK